LKIGIFFGTANVNEPRFYVTRRKNEKRKSHKTKLINYPSQTLLNESKITADNRLSKSLGCYLKNHREAFPEY
jgi:hypothetical protein